MPEARNTKWNFNCYLPDLGERFLRETRVEPCQSSLWLHLNQELRTRSNCALAKWFSQADNHSPSQDNPPQQGCLTPALIKAWLPRVRETDSTQRRKRTSKTWRERHTAFTILRNALKIKYIPWSLASDREKTRTQYACAHPPHTHTHPYTDISHHTHHTYTHTHTHHTPYSTHTPWALILDE